MGFLAEQRSTEWSESRVGKITCSRMKDVMARAKGKQEWCVISPDGELLSQHGGGKTGEKKANEAARKKDTVAYIETQQGDYLKAREDYLGELVVERLTGEARGIPMTAAMQWGTDCEPYGRVAYEARYGVVVEETGFIVHPKVPYVGGSPDGLLLKGGIEIKCPYNPINHLRTVIEGMPDEHIPQVQGNMWVTKAEFWDFLSYDPRMPEHLRLYVQRIERDEAFIARMAAECEALWADANQMIEDLEKVAA